MSPSRHTPAGTGRTIRSSPSRAAGALAAVLVAAAVATGSALAAPADSYDGGKERVVTAGPPQLALAATARATAAEDGSVRVTTRLRVSESGVLRVLVWDADGRALKLDCKVARFDGAGPSSCQQGGRHALFQVEKPRVLRIAVTVAAGEAKPGDRLRVRLAYTDRDIPGQPDRSGQSTLTPAVTVAAGASTR